MNIHIRGSDAQDLDALYHTEISATTLYHQSGFDMKDVTARTLQDLEQLLKETTVLVAENDEGNVMGYISYFQNGPYLHLEEVGVSTLYQRKGVGQTLLSTYIESGNKNGILGYTLTTFKNAFWSIELYKKLGFEELGYMNDDFDTDVLKEIIQRDIQAGLDMNQRVLMIKLKK
ncbi:Ribosomal protein S18 acetylase RimI [Thermoactinomyces sp. DSM 45891]|uniref:GNAT family N-acetyltransferase n=1 Tax=Thermoactinomyces sp. DSM 45891 TaxID=1761907 RepID=UPI0009155654|nr:GNAT family N-acetyltransferase [Thermoactinomyces sp. DSM 45891]SFX48766.1 Ribosomal protein S18 acetylase RimI [Thermoactinomyces sp. DSM 45891]